MKIFGWGKNTVYLGYKKEDPAFAESSYTPVMV